MVVSAEPRAQGRRQDHDKPVRVLHVLARIGRGGIEACLLNLLRTLPRERFETVVAWHFGDGGGLLDDFRALGAIPYRLPPPSNPLRHTRDVRRLFERLGPFEVIHTHLNFAGIFILAARLAGIPVRVAQSHMAPALMTPGVLSGSYVRLTNRLFLRCTTHGIGVSEEAAVSLFGRRWRLSPTVDILPCGIDLTPFRATSKVSRKDLGLPDDALVVAHVGRLAPEKNHAFLLSIMRELLAAEPHSRLLLVGDGPLETELKVRAAGLGIADKVIFTGARTDVPALLMGVVDVLALPSLSEGLSLVALEAQAAGIPSVISLAMPQSATVWPGLVRRLSIGDSPRDWAAAVLEATGQPRPDRDALLGALAESQFDFQYTAKTLRDIYLSARRPAGQ